MSHRLRWSARAGAPLLLALLTVAASSTPAAAQVDPASFAALEWGSIGLFRAGRVSAGAVDPLLAKSKQAPLGLVPVPAAPTCVP
jgi:hypothetical protein